MPLVERLDFLPTCRTQRLEECLNSILALCGTTAAKAGTACGGTCGTAESGALIRNESFSKNA